MWWVAVLATFVMLAIIEKAVKVIVIVAVVKYAHLPVDHQNAVFSF